MPNPNPFDAPPINQAAADVRYARKDAAAAEGIILDHDPDDTPVLVFGTPIPNAVPVGGGAGAVLVKASDDDLDIEWLDLIPPLPSGSGDGLFWLRLCPAAGTPSSVAMSVGVVRYTPFYVSGLLTPVQVGIKVIQAAAGSHVLVGVYDDDGSGRPGALNAFLGQINSGVTGHQFQAIDVDDSIGTGWHWVGTLAIGGAPTVASFISGSYPFPIAGPGSDPGALLDGVALGFLDSNTGLSSMPDPAEPGTYCSTATLVVVQHSALLTNMPAHHFGRRSIDEEVLVFRRFGAAEVLSVHTGAQQTPAHVRKQAHRAVFAYVPREGMVYVRSRAISSRCNHNFDFFGAEEIEKAYRSFIGKPVFVNHHNSNHHQARGVIIDAALHRDRNPNGSPDTWVEVLMEVDGRTYPKLAMALVKGDIDRTSMGCDVQISKCSVCGNEAKNPHEYCRHIPAMKGQRIFQIQPNGQRLGKLVYEECFGLSFFENSLLVEPPADPTAFFLGKVDVGPGLEHLAKAARLAEECAEAGVVVEASRPGPMQRVASRVSVPQEMIRVNPADSLAVAHQALVAAFKQASFLNDYPSDDEVDLDRRGRSPGEQKPWVPYRRELESRPAPRETYLPHVAQDGPSSREHGTRYKQVPHDHPKAMFPDPSPEDEYHGPYEVIKHPDTGKYHVVDNQGRATRYGGSDGMDDVHRAQYMRDYAEHRQSTKEMARGLADSIYNRGMEALDPGGTPESRESERNVHSMNNLQNLGYQPHHIKFDEEDGGRPYAEVKHTLPGGHPSGWFGRDHGGSGYLSIHHEATGDEQHDAVQQGRYDEEGREHRIPGYGPSEAHQDLDHWYHDQESGSREHYENDPRIQRWIRRRRASLAAEAASKVKSATQPEAEAYLKDHPIGVHHILDRVSAASQDPATLHSGMKWYDDAHGMAQTMASHHNVPLSHAAGVLGVYSASSAPAPNFHMASLALHAGRGIYSGRDKKTKEFTGDKGIGGKGGMEPHEFDYHGDPMASAADAHKVDRILSGEHYNDVIGSSKTKHYARLIDDPSNSHDVVIDRHAVAAALGHVGSSGTPYNAVAGAIDNANVKGGGKIYDRVADAYRQAAHHLNNSPEHEEFRQHLHSSGLLGEGEQIKPHHVQALAWIVQKQISDQHARNDMSDANQKNIDAWQNHYTSRYGTNAHQPLSGEGFYGQEPTVPSKKRKKTASRVRTAYNETKAPTDVDTLRDESCAICGNDIAFDGRECQVCGYIAPPKGLDDPDVDKAKQLDQLKQNVEDERNESGLDPSQPGADFDAGDPDDLDPGGDNSANPWLECTNCGTGMRPTAPQTTGGTPPGAEAPAGPAEGDVCPVCQKGQLASTGESEDDTDALAEADAEEDEDSPGEVSTGSDKGSDQPPPEDDDDSDDDDPDAPVQKKRNKNPAGKATAAMKYRDHSKESPMNNALRALAAQQQTAEAQQVYIDHLQRGNASLHKRLAAKDSQIQRLSAGLAVVARLLGPQAETMIRQAMLTKRADEQNPAQPIPEPAAQPPSQTTVDAKTPEAFADVRMPGMVPGSNQDVAADAVTTAFTPGQDIGAPPVRQLVDVTAPVDGTQGPRPINETKTNVDVRAGSPMNPQTAFPLNGDFANAQRTGSVQGAPSVEADELRTMASIRLARLQIASGIAQGDDLSVGQRILSDPLMSIARITQEINTLNQVRTAAAQVQSTMPPRGSVPQRAGGQPVQRIVPPLSTTASAGQGGSSDDSDVEAVFL